MSLNHATSFDPVNYSGMLFNKGNTHTPLSSIIGVRRKITNHVEFAIGQEYTSEGGTQPSISEEASLTAPTFSPIARTQETNITQIFQESVGISYGKQSNMGTLHGLNVGNQQANPMNELDFQVAAKMAKMAGDIEYTIVNGVFQKATTDATANKTRGLVTAITSNVTSMAGAAIGYWSVVAMMEKIDKGNAPVSDLTLFCNTTTMLQMNGDAIANGLTVIDQGRNINGINLITIVTPFGNLNMLVGKFIPPGTAFLLNLPVLSVVEQPVPGKGNFFMEELAKTGAGIRYQIFGQLGLDYGAEWYHGKFTDIKTTFTPPVAPTP